jgi:hypothetical protein
MANRKECIYQIKITHFGLLKVYIACQQKVTDWTCGGIHLKSQIHIDRGRRTKA